METITPFRRLKGTTAKNTRVDTLFIAPFTLVPIATIWSKGIQKRAANFGSRYIALKALPNVVIISVPAAIPMSAVFLPGFAWYIMLAGSTKEQPTAKFAKSPTKAVVVPLRSNLTITLTSSAHTPDTGPR